MKALLASIVSTLVLVSAGLAQDKRDEPELRDFLGRYEHAKASHDVGFLEGVLADEYVYSSPGGRATNRAGVLEHFRRQAAGPAEESKSLKHENVELRRVGDMALVTHDWIAETTPTDSPGAEATTDKGRYTGVFERRDGRWVVLAEHDSEQIHDEHWMLSGVAKAARQHRDVLQRLGGGRAVGDPDRIRDLASYSRLLADEYSSTEADGAVFDKSRELGRHKAGSMRLESVEVRDQAIRAIDNSAVVETATTRSSGTNGGRHFELGTRDTTVWAFYDGRWQITAHHASPAGH